MTNSKLRVLIDCDNVLSDFTGICFELIAPVIGRHPCREEAVTWDIFDSFGIADKQELLRPAIVNDKLCTRMKPIPGSQRFIDDLRDFTDVYVVTTPYPSPNWEYERREWLKNHYGFENKHVVQTHSKWLVAGDVFIDDKYSNVVSWKAHNPSSIAYLWDQPYNRNYDYTPRMSSWSELLRDIKMKSDIVNLISNHYNTNRIWV